MFRSSQGVLGYTLVAFGAREVEDDLLGLVFSFAVHGTMGMEELIGEVAENGGAAGRDASLGDLDDEAGEESLDVLAGRELVEFGEEVGGYFGFSTFAPEQKCLQRGRNSATLPLDSYG